MVCQHGVTHVVTCAGGQDGEIELDMDSLSRKALWALHELYTNSGGGKHGPPRKGGPGAGRSGTPGAPRGGSAGAALANQPEVGVPEAFSPQLQERLCVVWGCVFVCVVTGGIVVLFAGVRDESFAQDLCCQVLFESFSNALFVMHDCTTGRLPAYGDWVGDRYLRII